MILALAAVSAFAQDVIIIGTDGNDVLTGNAVGESIYGRAGNDVINGGGGDDELDGGPGADVLNGGDGGDAVLFSGATGVSVTLDGIANDGIADERDNVGNDVEDIFGGDGADKLNGSRAANTLDGGAGDDTLTGGGGKDAIFAGAGDDRIKARDGSVDRIDCGAGDDVVEVDSFDVTTSCRLGVTDVFDLTVRPRERRLLVGSLDPVSTIVLACVRSCKPRLAPTKVLLRRNGIRSAVTSLRLTSRMSGATLEIGVTRSNARTRCVRFRLGTGFRSYRRLKNVRCTTVARSLGS